MIQSNIFENIVFKMAGTSRFLFIYPTMMPQIIVTHAPVSFYSMSDVANPRVFWSDIKSFVYVIVYNCTLLSSSESRQVLVAKLTCRQSWFL